MQQDEGYQLLVVPHFFSLTETGSEIDYVWWSPGYQAILLPHLFSELPTGVTAVAVFGCVSNQQAGNKCAPLNTLTLWGHFVVKSRTGMIPGLALSTFMHTQPGGWGRAVRKSSTKIV